MMFSLEHILWEDVLLRLTWGRMFCWEPACDVFWKLCGKRACNVLEEWMLERTCVIWKVYKYNLTVDNTVWQCFALLFFSSLLWTLLTLAFTDATVALFADHYLSWLCKDRCTEELVILLRIPTTSADWQSIVLFRSRCHCWFVHSVCYYCWFK